MTDATPRRVRLSHRKGWHLPPHTLRIDDDPAWRNPYTPAVRAGFHVVLFRPAVAPSVVLPGRFRTPDEAILSAHGRYRRSIERRATAAGITPRELLDDLTGWNLACWCPLDQPCHVDVLLDLANTVPVTT